MGGFSPTSYFKTIAQNTPVKKKRIKIISPDVLTPNKYSNLIVMNYKVLDLKSFCKHYKIKKSGNKEQLVKRLYNHLRFTFFITKIQKLWRRYLLSRHNQIRGPAYLNRKLCVNETDFYTLEPISGISHEQFMSFQDKDEKIYGFDVASLNCLLQHNNKNPYNRNVIDVSVKKNIKKLELYSRIFNNHIVINVKETEKISLEKTLELKIIGLFQCMDDLGNYTDSRWFSSLNKPQLIRFIRELVDIWKYRADLSNSTKREICPPYGDPFRYIQLNNIQMQSITSLKMMSVKIIEQLIKTGYTNADKILGATYVLCALTLVNNSAATAMPWLYQSVAMI